jgi:hypothetical protein
MLFLLLFNFLYGNDKLISVQILARHGDRGPLIDIPVCIKIFFKTLKGLNFTYPLGHLTPEGLSQHKKLGEYIKIHYANFLSDNYDDKNIYLRSSYYPRCILSLWALTTGLFPNGILDDGILAWPIRFFLFEKFKCL